MIESATGLILRTRPLTESSLIVHWLTPTAGRLATVAKGARRPGSPFAGRLDLFYQADFVFYRSRRSELHTLKEVQVRQAHAILRTDLRYLRAASYCAALLEQVTEPETPLPALFNLMCGFLDALLRQPVRATTIFRFELKLLEELGLKPDLANSRLSPGAQQMASALLGGDWDAASRLEPTPAQTTELRRFLHGFLIYHLGRIPHGRAAVISPASS